MSHANLILGLPVELSGEIVGRWLHVEDIARLDSAFCQTEARKYLHRSIFASSSCIVTKVDHHSLGWIAARALRVERAGVRGKNDLISVEYLQMFGKHIKSVRLTYFSRNIGDCFVLIARYCVNLRSVEYSADYISDSFLELLNTCPGIESLKVSSCADNSPSLNVEPKIKYLRVHSLDIDCEQAASERILSMCVPESVQRLRIAEGVNIAEPLTNVRSLGFQRDYKTYSEVLDMCPSVINLDMSVAYLFADCEIADHVPPLRSLNLENGRMDIELPLLCHGFVQKHRNTLGALYLFCCEKVTEDSINLILAECPHLHTLSVDEDLLTDYTRIANITTLITDPIPNDKWELLQQHCCSLQHLHLVFTHREVQDLSGMVGALSEMPILRELYFAGVPSEHKQFYAEDVDKMRALRPTLYIEENEAEWTWYDLFKMPI